MRTDQLIDLLARGAGPAPRALPLRRLLPGGMAGFAAAAALALALAHLVPMNVLAQAGWWTKFAYAAAVALTAGWLAARLGRPAAPAGRAAGALLLVVAMMVAAGLVQWVQADPSEHLALLRGHSSAQCSRNVFLLSLPAVAGAFWALRGLAPTRPRLTGAIAGLFAGGVGAAGYALVCTELEPVFVAVWYTLGIVATGALGALLGPRLLRW